MPRLGIGVALLLRQRFTYVYTRASKRGVTEKLIDSVRKGRPNLHTPELYGEASQYEGALRRRHVNENGVTGERNPRTSNWFVDFDRMLVE